MNHYTDEARAGGLFSWKHMLILFVVICILIVVNEVVF